MKPILILTPFFSPNLGGVETHLHDLTRGLSQLGHKVYVLTYQPLVGQPKGPKLEKQTNLYIRRFWWPGYGIFNWLQAHAPSLNLLYLVPGLLAGSLFFMKRQAVDVIHAHGLAAGLIGAVLKRFFAKPLLVSTHAIYDFAAGSLSAQIAAWILGQADQIFCLSQPSQQQLLSWGLKSSQVSTYTYWVDQAIFKPGHKNKARIQLNWATNGFYVLFVGRLIKEKGVNLLPKIAKQLPDVNFVVVGAGPEQNKLKLKNIGLAGKKSQLQLAGYYQAADLLLVPSLYAEGFGRVIIEALSCGLPVLASRKGAISQAVGPKAGVLVKPETKHFVREIKHLRANTGQLKTMSTAGLKRAQAKYSQKNIKQFVQAYERLTG